MRDFCKTLFGEAVLWVEKIGGYGGIGRRAGFRSQSSKEGESSSLSIPTPIAILCVEMYGLKHSEGSILNFFTHFFRYVFPGVTPTLSHSVLAF